MGSRFEVWTHPSTGIFERRIPRLEVIDASITLKNTAVEGARLTLPPRYPYINLLLRRDINNPANTVRSVIRVFDDDAPDTAAPIAEMVPTNIPDAIDPSHPTSVTCAGILRSFTWDSIVWAFDHPVWLWPDWIWGGRNVLANPGFEETRTVGARYTADGDATGGTWVINVDGDDANIAIPTNAAAIKVALEALQPGYRVEVSGLGTASSPWEIEFLVPYQPAVTTDTSGTTGGVIRTVAASAGQLLPVAWEPSRHPVTNQPHGYYSFWGLNDASPDTGVYALEVNGVDIGVFDFPGAQQLPEVAPGGIYQASLRFRPTNTTDPWRFVLRDMREGIPAEFPDPLEFTGTTPGTYQTVSLGTVQIPADLDQLIFRLGYIGGGDAGSIMMDNAELREGLAPATCGEILRLLHEDATTNHAGDVPARVSLGFIVLGFSDTLDSNGNAWDRLLSFTVVHGQRFWQVLEGLKTTFGYEFELVWNGTNWTLEGYNPGTRGQQDPLLVPGIVVGVNAVVGGPLSYDTLTGNAVLAEGAQRLWSRSEDAAAITAAGRIETYVPMGNVLDQATLDAAAANQVLELLSQGLSIALTIAPGAKPFLGTGGPDGIPLGSMVHVTVPGHLNQYPVRLDSVELRWPRGGTSLPSRTGHFSSEVFDDEAGTKEMVRRIAERHASAPPPKPEPKRDATLGGGGGDMFTVVVAASNAGDRDKEAADLVATDQDATSTINDAIALINANGGGNLWFTIGWYDVNLEVGLNSLNFPTAVRGTTISDGNPDGTVFQAIGAPGSTTRRPIWTAAGDFVSFRDFSIFEQTDDGSATGIQLQGLYSWVENIYGFTFGHFIRSMGGYATITGNTLSFGGFGSASGRNHGIFIDGPQTGTRVLGNLIEFWEDFGVYASGGTFGTEGNMASNNVIVQCEAGGIYVGVTGVDDEATGGSRWGWVISGNQIEGCSGNFSVLTDPLASIHLQYAPGTAVVGNAITNAFGHGMIFESEPTGSNPDPWVGTGGGTIVSGNSITRTSGFALWFRNADTEAKFYPITVAANHIGSDGNDANNLVQIERMRDISIQANNFQRCGLYLIECEQVSILANKFLDASYGQDGGTTGKTGIIELDDSHFCTVKDNDFQAAEGQVSVQPQACVYLLNGSDNNRIRGNDYLGIAALSPGSTLIDYGVWFAASAGSNNRAVGNDFELTAVASIQDDAGGNATAWPGGGNDNW